MQKWELDFNVQESLGKWCPRTPSAILPKMAHIVVSKFYDKNSRHYYKYNIRALLEKVLCNNVLPTLSGVREVLFDNYVFLDKDLQLAHPKFKVEHTVFYTNNVYKVYRHPCVIDDMFVFNFGNEKIRQKDLTREDFMIVDDKGTIRVLNEHKHLFKKIDDPVYIGDKYFEAEV